MKDRRWGCPVRTASKVKMEVVNPPRMAAWRTFTGFFYSLR